MVFRLTKLSPAPLVLAFLCVAAPALAQAPAIPEAAKLATEQGMAATRQNDWGLALKSFLAAQELAPAEPKILFNLGLVSEKIPGHALRAIAWFQAFLLVAPNDANAQAVRAEVKKLEDGFETGNRAVLDQIEKFISIGRKNIDQLAGQRGEEWTKYANFFYIDGLEYMAGARYYDSDEAGALRILHGADEKLFRDGQFAVPFPSPLLSATRDMAGAMLSAGLGVNEIVYGLKPRDFTVGELAQLDYLLEVGALEDGWIFLNGWREHNAPWMVGLERLLCTAHDRADRKAFDKVSTDIRSLLVGMSAGWAYSDIVRLYLEMGEIASAETLAKSVPPDLERETAKDYKAPNGREALSGTANGLMADFRQGRFQSRASCPGELSTLVSAESGGVQTLEWGKGTPDDSLKTETLLWWSSGRLAYLIEVGRNGVQSQDSKEYDETRLGDYVKKINDELTGMANAIALDTRNLARTVFYISKAYRQVRGPAPSGALSRKERGIPYETQGFYDRGLKPYTPVKALGLAAAHGYMDAVNAWVKRGVNVNAKDENGSTSLFYAASGGQIDVARFLLAQGADMAARDDLGFTPLIMAVLSNKPEIAKFLLSQGADINAKDNEGKTAMHWALQNKASSTFVALLAANGANVNAKDDGGLTALHLAALFSQLDALKILVANRADVNAKTSTDGTTPLHWAVQADHISLPLIQYLIDHGADINAKDKTGSTPMDTAAKNNKGEIVTYLTAHGGR